MRHPLPQKPTAQKRRNKTDFMIHLFPNIIVSEDAAESTETMGTKLKFWFRNPAPSSWLYKQARPNTGENWAEKIAAELCERIGLPHAHIELATWNGNLGTASPSFVSRGDTLIHGNEILAPLVPNYPQSQAFKVSQHTLDIVLTTISNSGVNQPLDWTPPVNIQTAVDTFVGYLLLDTWIGNTDRHHENWGFIAKLRDKSTPHLTTHLAPTYDHASSLGRELLDTKRQQMLNNGSVPAYAARCTSALYAKASDKKAMKPLDAFREVAQRYPNAAQVWLERLASVSPTETLALFNRVPPDCISQTAIAFAQQLLEINQRRLLDLREALT